jgi:hypothetical protein
MAELALNNNHSLTHYIIVIVLGNHIGHLVQQVAHSKLRTYEELQLLQIFW